MHKRISTQGAHLFSGVRLQQTGEHFWLTWDLQSSERLPCCRQSEELLPRIIVGLLYVAESFFLWK